MKRLMLACLLLALLGSTMSSATETPAADPRLDQKVTIKTVGKPLGDFLALVSDATGVKMTARSEVADYRVCMYVKDLPLSRLQDALKHVLHLQFTQKGSPGEWSYEFWEDISTQREVERLKKQELEKFRAVVEDLVEDLKLSDGQLIEKFGRKKDIPYALLYPWHRSLLKAYSFVDKAQLNELWQKGSLRLGRTDISREMQNELVRGLNDDSEPSWEEPAGEAEEADTAEEVASEYYHLSEWISINSVDFGIEDSGGRTGLQLTIRTAGDSIDISGPGPDDRKADRNEMDISVGPKEYENTPAADPVESWLSGETQPAAEPEWPISRYIEDPGFEPPHDEDGEYSEDAVPEEQPADEQEYVPPMTHYEMLVMIAEKTGINIISDRFASVDMPYWVVSDKPGDWPLSVIDKLAESMNADMTKDGELRLLVNREWFRNRDREVPERLVKRWMPIAKKLGYLDLEQIIEVSALTDAQIMSLPSYGLPYVGGESTEDMERVRLLASLTPSQWTAVKSEDGLPVSSLSGQQGKEFMDWLTRVVSTVGDEPDAETPDELRAIKVSPDYLDWDDKGRKVKIWHFSLCWEDMEDIMTLPCPIYEDDGNGYGTIELWVAGKP